jgi:hypothetical protein
MNVLFGYTFLCISIMIMASNWRNKMPSIVLSGNPVWCMCQRDSKAESSFEEDGWGRRQNRGGEWGGRQPGRQADGQAGEWAAGVDLGCWQQWTRENAESFAVQCFQASRSLQENACLYSKAIDEKIMKECM